MEGAVQLTLCGRRGTMLKITVKRDDERSTLMLEGKLAGPWVAELQNSWDGEQASGKQISLDLNEVTFVDAEGKALLTKLHEEGAKLISRGCLMRSIVARICGEPFDATTHQNKVNSTNKIVKVIVIGLIA